MYYGDITLGDTIDIKFTTRKFSTGAPFALAGGVISAYIGNDAAEITAGITLSADFDGVTGLNNVRVVATSGNGFTTATNVILVITTGTVDSVSVVGEVVAAFSIAARAVTPRAAAIAAASFAAGAIDAAALATDAANEIADAFLARSLAGGSSAGTRTVKNALRASRNKVTITTGGAVTVFEEDDTTPAWTGTATRDAAAEPITDITPA